LAHFYLTVCHRQLPTNDLLIYTPIYFLYTRFYFMIHIFWYVATLGVQLY